MGNLDGSHLEGGGVAMGCGASAADKPVDPALTDPKPEKTDDEANAKKKAEAEAAAAARKKEEDEAALKKQEDEAASKRAEEEAAKRKQQDSAEAAKRAEAEAKEAEARKLIEDAQKVKDDAAAKIQSRYRGHTERRLPRVERRWVVLGPPGSGKAVQCARLSEKFGVIHVSAGELLRDQIAKQTAVGKKVQQFVEEGRMVADNTISKLVVERLQQADCKQHGWVVEGFPQSLSQSAALEEAGLSPSKVGMLKLSQATMNQRCEARRFDAQTGTKYFEAIPEDEEASVGGEMVEEAIRARLVRKQSDLEEVLGKRVAVFNDQMNDIAAHYKSILKNVDAERAAERVFDDCIRMVESNPWQMIVVGGPASGKGRLIESCVGFFELVHLTVPLILKSMKTTEVGKRAFQAMMDDKEPDVDDVCTLVVERIQKEDCLHKGYMLDGFPNSKESAQLLKTKGMKVQQLVLVDCSIETALDRQIHRRRDKKTGKVYDLKTNPPPEGAVLVHRQTDSPEEVTARFEKYLKEVDGIDLVFGKKSSTVDGNVNDAQLFQQTLDVLHSSH